MPEPLTHDQIATALENLPGWEHGDDELNKSFEFADFKAALAFINRVGEAAEALGHHPELFNVYNRVKLALSTHDADGRVTQLDVDLAGRINAAAEA
ncbi:MAG: 4a-hydroxytetrahydrobiopterin dehydratase [Planctomycetota bacterium]